MSEVADESDENQTLNPARYTEFNIRKQGIETAEPMAKRKKRSAILTTRGFGSKSLEAELHRAERYLIKEDWKTATEILLGLSQQHPEDKKVWGYLTEAVFEMGDMQLYQKACEGLLAADPKNGNSAYALASVYLNNQHPLLAMETFQRALELAPDHELAPRAKEMVAKYKPMLQELLQTMGLTEANGKEIAILHERGQAYLEQGDYVAAREAENEVLQAHPEFMSARNNLSLISWIEGDAEAAIATGQAVLEQEPDNIHALSNLIRFHVISGDADHAQPYSERLKASHAKAWDGWTKKVEGLSHLADDAGIVEIFEQAEAAETDDSDASALFYHLSAVALARTGDKKRAIAQWEKALKLNPNLSLAKENLSDTRKATGQQHGPWPFSWEQWLTPKTAQELQQALQNILKAAKSGNLTTALNDFLSNHPDVMAMMPRLLERGGPSGQEFVLNITEQLKTPELLEIIKDFALSQNGTDQMRNRAAVWASQAKLIPKDKVTLWIGGQWREIMLMAYEFHDEPTRHHSKKVSRWVEQANKLLHSGDERKAAEAEGLFKKALEVEPDSPDVLNNLAVAYLNQGREDESNALIDDIVERYPDYIFARAALARRHILAGDLEAAEALLQPLMTRDRFQFQEFSECADAYIELSMAKKEPNSARSWLNMWKQVDPDHPRLDYWENRLKSRLRRPF